MKENPVVHGQEGKLKSDISSQSRQSKTSKPSRKLSQPIRSRTTKSTVLPNDDFVDSVIVIPPDGGWGWLIVAMAFICNFIVDGIMFTFGLFLNEVSDSFGVHPTKIALANSIMSGLYFMAGPFTCALSNRCGFRTVGILGGIISSTAFLLSTISDSVTLFLILIGGICGIGFNMIYIPSLLIVGFYFERWRALAMCLSVCGSSVGIIAFPPIITKLLKNYSWRWKFRLLSGVLMATLVCILTYWPIKPIKLTEEKKDNVIDDSYTIDSLHIEKEQKTFSVTKLFQHFHNTVYPTVTEVRQDSNTVLNLSRITEDSSTFLTVFESNPSSATINKSEGIPTIFESQYRTICCNKNCCKNGFFWCSANETPEVPNRPMYRDDILYTGSLNVLPEYSKSKATVISGPSAKKSAVTYHMSVTRVATTKDIEQSGRCICCPEAVIRTVATMMDIRLLKSPSFMVLTASGFVTMLGLYSPFIFLIQRAEDMNIDKEWCTLLLTFLGTANTAGRILCGIVSSFPKTDAIMISYVTTFITGAVTIASNYLHTLEGQIIFAVLFGLNIASFGALRSVILVELVGLENLTNAFGISTLFLGIGSFLGIPISGILQKHTGTYDASFLFAGCAILISAILLLPVKIISKWEKNKNKPKVTFRA